MSIPEATNPNLHTNCAHCAVGQAGPVWFLAGSFAGSFTRACTVPSGERRLGQRGTKSFVRSYVTPIGREME
jgi:hypothetical protein